MSQWWALTLSVCIGPRQPDVVVLSDNRVERSYITCLLVFFILLFSFVFGEVDPNWAHMSTSSN